MPKLNYIVNVEDITKQITLKDTRGGEYHFIRVKGYSNYNSYRKVDMGGRIWYVQVNLPAFLYKNWIVSGLVDTQINK